jgi:hypothetical protein
VSVLAGCGGEGEAAAQLPNELAQRLAERSDSVAALLEAGDACGARNEAQRLQADAIAAVNEGEVPTPLQEELLATVTELAQSIQCPRGRNGAEAEDARSLSSWLRERT